MNRSRNIIITLIIIIAILAVALIGAIVYILMDNNKKDNNIVVNNTNNDVFEDETTEELEDDIEKSNFNETFEAFEGTKITGTQIRVLLFEVTKNNADDNNEHAVYLNENGITAMDQLDDSKTYTVEIFYDDEEYVNEIKITDNSSIMNENTDENTEKISFNITFISYIGEITGERLNTLLQKAMESNNKYPEHQVNLSSNNLQTLEGIVATDTYIISLSYDAEGYVNNINIDKKM